MKKNRVGPRAARMICTAWAQIIRGFWSGFGDSLRVFAGGGINTFSILADFGTFSRQNPCFSVFSKKNKGFALKIATFWSGAPRITSTMLRRHVVPRPRRCRILIGRAKKYKFHTVFGPPTIWGPRTHFCALGQGSCYAYGTQLILLTDI